VLLAADADNQGDDGDDELCQSDEQGHMRLLSLRHFKVEKREIACGDFCPVSFYAAKAAA
jgi:hypothetical protein